MVQELAQPIPELFVTTTENLQGSGIMLEDSKRSSWHLHSDHDRLCCTSLILSSDEVRGDADTQEQDTWQPLGTDMAF